MFPIPNLPTDNLYKFTFLSGIVLLIFSSYLITIQSDTLHAAGKTLDSLTIVTNEITKVNSRISTLKTNEADRIIKNADKTVEKLRNLEQDKISNPKRYTELQLNLKKDIISLLRVQAELDSNRTSLRQQQVQRDLVSKKTMSNIENIKTKSKTLLVYIYFGTALALLGGLCWYRIVQIPQDKLNRIQLELAELQLEEMKFKRNVLQPIDALKD